MTPFRSIAVNPGLTDTTEAERRQGLARQRFMRVWASVTISEREAIAKAAAARGATVAQFLRDAGLAASRAAAETAAEAGAATAVPPRREAVS